MPIRKKGNIKIQTSPKGTQVKQTGYTFYSYDKDSAALIFTFVNGDDTPVNLKKADIRLIFILNDSGKKITVNKDDIDVISAIRGTAHYIIPESLLGYVGGVTGYVYLEFSDGSHTDEGRFTFNIKRSLITDVIPEAGEQYVKDFEDIKSQVEQAKNSAIKDIDKALPEVQAKIEEVSGKINELDMSDTNLLTGTSDEWEQHSFSGWTAGYMEYTLEELDVKAGEVLTYQVEYDNTLDESSSALSALVSFYDEANGNLDSIRGSRIARGEKGVSFGSLKVPEGAVRLVAYKMYKSESGNPKTGAARKHKLQRGSYATDWTPNPSEIITKKDYDKLAEAIINLGGSV